MTPFELGMLSVKEAGKRGLWDNIHAKRERGEAPAKPGDEDYPDQKSWNKTVKEGGLFYRDIDPESVLINEERHGQPMTTGLGAVRTQDPRMLTRLFSNPQNDIMKAIKSLDFNQNVHTAESLGKKLVEMYPSRYRAPNLDEHFRGFIQSLNDSPAVLEGNTGMRKLLAQHAPMRTPYYLNEGDRATFNNLMDTMLAEDPSLDEPKPKKTTKKSGDAWQRAEGKNPEGGLNAKGRASLKAEGQDIKPPVTEDKPTGERADRKSSFCARMGGMKKKLTSSETANDPDSRINKALRKWNC